MVSHARRPLAQIGGDTQSTDGTEPSYKHFREEVPQCGTTRGYEMWLLEEAHKRNPDIQSYLLSWGIPNWVGNASFFSAENIACGCGTQTGLFLSYYTITPMGHA